MRCKETRDAELFQANRGVFSDTQMAKIRKSHVLIAGLGGLGGHLAIAFARAGVARLTLVDFDRFEPSNINRQALCDQTTLQALKTDVFEKALKRIHPDLVIDSYATRIEHLEDTVYTHVDLIVDGLDTISSKRHLEACALRAKKPFLHGAIGGMYGQYGLFDTGEPLLENLYGLREAGIETSARNPTFTPGVLAHLMASEGICHLGGEPCANTLRIVDLNTHDIRAVYLHQKEKNHG